MSNSSARLHWSSLIVAALALVLTVKPLHAQTTIFDKDTPATVQKAEKASAVLLDDYITVMKEARAVVGRMAADPLLAGKVLTAAKKNDQAAIISMLKPDAPNSTIAIVELKDWTATLSFTYKGYKVTVCGSSEAGCSGGTTATVAVK